MPTPGPSDTPTNRIALVALVALTIIWGYNWVVVKTALHYIDPFDFAALRGMCGVIGLFIVLLVIRIPLRPRAIPATILLGFLQITVFLALTNYAMVAGGAGKTAVLVYTMPFWTILFAWPLLGEKIKGLQWLSVFIALTGLLLILEPWSMQATLVSNVCATLGGASWAASVIVARKLGQRKDIHLLSLTAWQMLFGVIPLIALAWVLPSRPIEWSGYFVFAVFYAGFLATVVGWFLWLYVLRHLAAGTASINSLAIPVIAVLSAWIELGEAPSPTELAGMLCIAVALLMISLLNIRKYRQIHTAAAVVLRRSA